MLHPVPDSHSSALHTQGLTMWSAKCQAESDAKTGNVKWVAINQVPSNRLLSNNYLSHRSTITIPTGLLACPLLQIYLIPSIPDARLVFYDDQKTICIVAILTELSLDKMIISLAILISFSTNDPKYTS